MSRSPRQRERHFALPYSRQRVISAHQNRLTVTCMISRSRSNAVKSPGPASHVVRGIGVIYPAELRLANLIEFLRQKLLISLVGFRVGWWIQIRRRLFDRHDIQRSHKRPRGGLGLVSRSGLTPSGGQRNFSSSGLWAAAGLPATKLVPAA